MNRYKYSYLLLFGLAICFITSCSSGEYTKSGTLDIASSEQKYGDILGSFSSTFDVTVENITNVDLSTEDLVRAELTNSVFYLWSSNKSLQKGDQVNLTLETSKGDLYSILLPVYIDPRTEEGYAYLDNTDTKYSKFIETMINRAISHKTISFSISGSFVDEQSDTLPNIPYQINIRNDLSLWIRGE